MSGLSAISLFSGAGGLDFGFEAAGFETAVAVEMDARCCTTLRANRRWPVIERDIQSVTTEEMLEAAGLRPGEADILIGGPPCQPFSKSGFWATGDARRLSDPRANTLEAYFRVLAEARPRAFLLENVEGLGFKGKDEGLQLIHERLAAINRAHKTSYKASIALLNAADFGVPQLRRRLFVIGSRDGHDLRFPNPTHASPDGEGGLLPYLTAWDALHDLGEPNEPDVLVRGKWADLLPSIPEGENYLWHTDRGGGEPLFGWRRRYWSFLLKLAKNQPSWTIQAQPGPATGPFHWNNRRLSKVEMGRLQTFPRSVQIVGSIIDAQKQLGNAVPSLLAEVLARQIAVQLLGAKRRHSSPRLALRPALTPPPTPTAAAAVPRRFQALIGEHPPHPGTGQGARALARQLIAAE